MERNHVERVFAPVMELAARWIVCPGLGGGPLCGTRRSPNWKRQGLPGPERVFVSRSIWGIDRISISGFSTTDDSIRCGASITLEGIVSNLDDYLRLRPSSFRPRPGAMMSRFAVLGAVDSPRRGWSSGSH